MNQILVSEKLYVTPELKRKKKIYQFAFLISIICVCLLSSYYIYAEYDRTKSEEVSQEILAEIDNTTINQDDGILRVALEADTQEQNVEIQETESNKYVTQSGATYTTEAVLNIPSLGINYPVLSDTSEELLKISLNKFWGPSPNTVGNYCIVGHNYKNKKMFGKLADIKNGDIVELTDNSGKTIKYAVYNKYVVNPEDVACTSQLTNGNKEVTLITCTNYGKQRLVVKAREV
ncbi:MAG TPA: sortase [Clostridiaceae bacterium]|nr:sortase family protein [Clostridium sp. CAG:571]HJJ06466.1 sortase [Clostridiaceae bacterium]HJJ14026.1 sortase [Clostridiaceae bacterium]